MFRTKYLGPTDHRPARIKVTDVHFQRSIYVSWDDALGVEDNHDAAWREFLRRYDVSPRTWGRVSTSEGFLYVAKDAIRDM